MRSEISIFAVALQMLVIIAYYYTLRYLVPSIKMAQNKNDDEDVVVIGLLKFTSVRPSLWIDRARKKWQSTFILSDYYFILILLHAYRDWDQTIIEPNMRAVARLARFSSLR